MGGLCACGCGQETRLAPHSCASRNWVKGEPLLYISGHNGRRPLAERFWEKVHKTDDCWNWMGSLTRDGYGRISVGGRGGRPEPAHRVAYELVHGSIPAGLHIDHLCRNPRCVNPSHLEAVTQGENNRRAQVAVA